MKPMTEAQVQAQFDTVLSKLHRSGLGYPKYTVGGLAKAEEVLGVLREFVAKEFTPTMPHRFTLGSWSRIISQAGPLAVPVINFHMRDLTRAGRYDTERRCEISIRCTDPLIINLRGTYNPNYGHLHYLIPEVCKRLSNVSWVDA